MADTPAQPFHDDEILRAARAAMSGLPELASARAAEEANKPQATEDPRSTRDRPSRPPQKVADAYEALVADAKANQGVRTSERPQTGSRVGGKAGGPHTLG